MEEIKIGGRSNGKSLENAITFMKYIDELENNKLYGIKKSGNITLLTKTECIPISLIEKKKEELKNVLDIIKTGKDDFSKGQASVLERIIKMFDKELLDERNNTDE